MLMFMYLRGYVKQIISSKMSATNRKGPIIDSGVCRCCGGTKRCCVLNVEYEWQGQKEVYSDIFVDCFGLLLSHLDGEPIERAICATCVSRLREAAAFRRQVLSCEERLLKTRIHVQGDDVSHINIKEEIEDIKIDIDDTVLPPEEPSMLPRLVNDGNDDMGCDDDHIDDDDAVSHINVKEEIEEVKTEIDTVLTSEEPSMLPPLVDDGNDDIGCDDNRMDDDVKTEGEIVTVRVVNPSFDVERDYEEVEFLEEELSDDGENQNLHQVKAVQRKEEILGNDDNDSDDNETDNVDKESQYQEYKYLIVRPNPQPDTSLRNKRQRQYTEEEFKLAVEAVESKQLRVTVAARKYNIPRKTLTNKIRNINGNRETNANPQCKKISEFNKGIQSILTHTNATPFRNIWNKFYCLFCPGDTPHIEDPKDLRLHTHSKHTDKVKRIEFLMRPNYINEMIRFDVKNLTCKCDTKATWHEMLDHLKTKHDVNIEELRKRVVPYRLDRNEMSCAFCDYSSSFTNIDTHMNIHYKNHICSHCGDTFITKSRLQRHVKVHRTGKYPCNRCDKIFSREIYRKKHIDMVHMKKLMFKCVHCDERFSSDKLRFVHMENEHEDKLEIKTWTCKECDKTFPWRKEYTLHMWRFHGLGAHTCDECGKEFRERNRLENHKIKHTGVKKYECDVCQKPYFSKTTVLKHKKNKHSKPEQSE